MAHTWNDRLPHLEISNPDTGDVVVCGDPPGLDSDRVAFAAPLASRSDLEWLLRGLSLHPAVRHLVLWGDDAKAVGEALLALWREGQDEDGALPGERGRICERIDRASVDALRGDITLHDLRDASADELAAKVEELARSGARTARKAMPDPVAPSRKVFLSRKTSFPIFAHDLGDAWLQLQNLALKIGAPREREGVRFAHALNAVVTVGLPVIAEDLEVEEVPQAEIFPAVFEISRGDFERYYTRRKAAGDPTEAVCAELGSGQACCAERFTPNLVSARFDVEGDVLYGSFVLSRADVYTDWPLESLALVHLQRELADRRGLQAGPATFVVHSVELDERDWARSTQLLEHAFQRPLPLQVDHSGVFLFGNDGGKARAMLLDHDAGTIYWEDEFDTPQELSWYLVDAMPWLLPQHFRYIGQECATLTRAMQEGECYLQG